jgi:hypothetical protein
MMNHFFISYNKADRAWAEWIAWQLERAGYTTIIQAWDFEPGSNFVLEMNKGTIDAERTIAVFSPDYLSALYTQPEWAAAFIQDPTGEKRTLVPVRIRECNPEGLLKALVYIDLVGKNEIQARETLLVGVKRERFKALTAPHFPGAPTSSQPELHGSRGTAAESAQGAHLGPDGGRGAGYCRTRRRRQNATGHRVRLPAQGRLCDRLVGTRRGARDPHR